MESSPTLGQDGTVFVGSHDTNLHAVLAATGLEKWKYHCAAWVSISSAWHWRVVGIEEHRCIVHVSGSVVSQGSC